MKKIDLSERLNQKNTAIAITAIILFVVIGIIVAVAWHSTYLNTREVKITNITSSPEVEQLYTTAKPGYIGYNYKAGTKTVDLNKIIQTSKGARLVIENVVLLHVSTPQENDPVLSVQEGQEYIVIIKIMLDGTTRKQSYILGIKQENHLVEGPSPIDTNGIEIKNLI